MAGEISKREIVKEFMEGTDHTLRIVNMKYSSYRNDYIDIFYRDPQGIKRRTKASFYPFVWATREGCLKLCHGNKPQISALLRKYNIGVKKLHCTSNDGTVREEFENGYMFMFYAQKPMSYSKFQWFFKEAENPIYIEGKDKDSERKSNPNFLCVTPVEQHMIATGKRFFKGYDDYDQLLRMTFDLETTSLNPRKGRITWLGVRTNKGFEKVFQVKGETKEELDENEFYVIYTFIKLIKEIDPDIITAHNGENFDWNFLIVRLEELGSSMKELSKDFFEDDCIRKDTRQSILKLGGEIETYYATNVPNIIVTDSLHAVRRAQAIDSNILKADLKYATKYSKMNKVNRVYIPGNKINTTLNDTEHDYAFNDTNGKWYQINEKHPLKDGYEKTTGEYIVKRYLLDDIWEGDKVEWKFNTTNFLISKILPLPYKKCTTMGTAGQWKALMMEWSYKNNLAIPRAANTGKFTGGLSRLLCTGFVRRVVKLDYNSLYPSITLTWGISDTTDLLDSMLMFLEYVLTEREFHKGEKKKAQKIIDKLEPKILDKTATEEEIKEYRKAKADFSLADSKQVQMKQLANSFFGSYGVNIGSMFPWKSIKCAENITCIGRQCLRLMISHFAKLGYKPIVGDSVTSDTLLWVKDKAGNVHLVPISSLFNTQKAEIDALGREYDYSKKDYQVLCRTGWVDVSYIYRHKTDKDIYRVTDENGFYVDVTEDHSLFNDKQEKIKPSTIKEDTKLEYCKHA